ncbi:MAG: hypothetical protein KKE31_01620 [Planctomycetes bacterium]|nr:hypothetical protein [Planctomycetota bacterium]MBU1517826.1 hypothetical protein [Planctomycetota bacterium]MBU2457319.1 hypothetical protein [Planctomycetota bacterium]
MRPDKWTDSTENAGKAVYLSIGHGFGDNLMATAVIAGIKKEFPDMRIFVLTKRRWEIFENSPDVAACYNGRVVMGKNLRSTKERYPCNINITADLPCSPCWLEKPCEKPVCKVLLAPELIMQKLNELLYPR